MKKLIYLLSLVGLAMVIVACGGQETPTPAPTAVPEQPAEAPPTEEPAVEPAAEPVYGEAIVDSVIVEEQGDQYVANTKIMLPDTCTQIDEITQGVDSGSINITVATVRPGDLMCAASITEVEQPIPVDTAVLDDGEYTVSVNGVTADDPVVVGDSAAPEAAEVTGEVLYRERIALPDDAVLTVQIQDISLADAEAQVMGEQTYVTAGKQIPLPFAVPYNPADIVENHTYGLSVRITAAGDTLLFINDTVIPVITNDSPTAGITANVIMVNDPAAAGEDMSIADENAAVLSPDMASLDTQGLPASWQAIYAPEKPYDASQQPGPMGLPAHVEVLFGVTDPADRQFNDPIMYIIPVAAYEAMWEEAGSESVTNMMDAIATQTYLLPQPPDISGMPALPYEEVVGTNDLAVQVGRAVAVDQQTDEMATKNGYRFVGRWGQSPNPVTNQNLRYVYQGFTNDGAYLVSFFYPVRTDELPDDPSGYTEEEMMPFTNPSGPDDMQKHMDEKAEMLNGLSTDAWQPDLATLDALVASLKISDMAANGLVDKTWQWTGEVINPSTGEVTTNELNDAEFSLTFNEDGAFNGVADCNNIAGGVTVDGGVVGSIAFQPGPATAAFCGEASQDTVFMGLLAATQNYRVAPGGNVINLIMPAGGGDYVFEAVPPQAALAAEAPGPVERVVGRQVQWISFSDPVNGTEAIPEPERYQLLLNEDGTVNVQADCNMVQGTYTADGSSITFSFGPSTLAACPEDSLSDQYMQNLTAVRILFNQDGDVFLDLEADSGTMRFTDVAGSGSTDTGLPAELLDVTWQWVGFSDPANGPTEIPNPENYLLQFEADGRFLIQADCNSGSGVYSAGGGGGGISFVMGPLTLAYCGDDSLDTQYVQNLEAAAIWFMQDGDLYFDLIYDTGTMQFTAAAESMTPASTSSSSAEPLPEDAMTLDLQGLADSFSWEVVDGYPPSDGPGGIGSPAYMVVTFDGATVTETLEANGPRIAMYPAETYVTIAGEPVARQVEQLDNLLALAEGTTPEPETWMPLLPPVGNLMDRWVQYLKLPFTQGEGIRYISDSPYRQQIGVWANDTTGYYYQALTDDGRFYISMFWPVFTDALPNTADETPEDVKAQATSPDSAAVYQESIRTSLNGLPAADWTPDLDNLNALAASIQFQP